MESYDSKKEDDDSDEEKDNDEEENTNDEEEAEDKAHEPATNRGEAPIEGMNYRPRRNKNIRLSSNSSSTPSIDDIVLRRSTPLKWKLLTTDPR